MAVPCTQIPLGECVTDGITFLLLFVFMFAGPFVFLIFFYIAPGPSVINKLMAAKFTGSPILLKFRKDKRVDMLTGKYVAGSLMTQKDGTYMSQPESYFYLPNGMRVACCGEQYGTTIPLDVIRAVEELKKIGFNSIDEVQKYVEKVASPEAWAEDEGIEMSPEKGRLLRQMIATGEGKFDETSMKYLDYIQTKISRHRKMFLHFDKIYNFFKFNINPSILASTIEQIVAIKMNSINKGVNWGNVAIISMLIMIGGAVAFAIIVTVDPGSVGSVLPSNIGQSLGSSIGG